MRKYTASEARDKFSEVVSAAAFGDERVVISKSGKNIVAVVPFSELELLEFLETRIDLDEAKAALQEMKAKGGISFEKLKAELESGNEDL